MKVMRNWLVIALMIVGLCVGLICDSSPAYGEKLDKNVTVFDLSEIYKSVEIKIDDKVTGLNMKEEIAHNLNEGISPEDIILLCNPWGKAKELVPDRMKISDCEEKKFFYVVSPLAKGEVFRTGDVISFGDESSAAIYTAYDNDEDFIYFYGDNAISYQECKKLNNNKYAKFVIGNTAIYIENEEGVKPNGFRVEKISYDPYNNAFLYELKVHCGE